MKRNLHTGPFNNPFKAGVRSLMTLVTTFPEAYDLQRFAEVDYLVVHSGDVNNPASLYAPLPMRAGELLVKHGLIEKGLLLMISRGLVQGVAVKGGFRYQAGEVAAPLMASLTAEYSCRLRRCVKWVVIQSNDLTIQEIRNITHRFFQ